MSTQQRPEAQFQTTKIVRRCQCRQRRGAAVVELAFTAPILFLLVFGMIDIGRAVMVQNLITNAARDGARAAVLDGATAAEIQSDVTTYLSASSVDGATATVSPSPLSSADLGDPVTVTVQVPFSSVSWLPSSMYLSGATLQASVVMRREVSNSTTSSP
jgi:Flp pilus assembly protein TadG